MIKIKLAEELRNIQSTSPAELVFPPKLKESLVSCAEEYPFKTEYACGDDEIIDLFQECNPNNKCTRRNIKIAIEREGLRIYLSKNMSGGIFSWKLNWREW